MPSVAATEGGVQGGARSCERGERHRRDGSLCAEKRKRSLKFYPQVRHCSPFRPLKLTATEGAVRMSHVLIPMLIC